SLSEKGDRMRVCLTVAIVIVCASAIAQAHHSIAGMYDQSRRVSIDGVIAEFHNVNPHPFVLVDVKDDRGLLSRWKLELDNRSELAAIGIRNDTLKPGDRVVVNGSPARSDPAAMYVWRLERQADGFLYEQIGTSPRVRGLPR